MNEPRWYNKEIESLTIDDALQANDNGFDWIYADGTLTYTVVNDNDVLLRIL